MEDAPKVPSKKRSRNEDGEGGDLKRVAEIVMVLSAMGAIRGGAAPAPAERALAAAARRRLVGVCKSARPKDLFSREAVRAVAEDLGLSRSRDPNLGFRPPRMSIADKILLTKRRMEESKEPATVFSPQPLPVGFGTNSESSTSSTMLRGTSGFLPDRPSPMTISVGSFQNVPSSVHGPDVASMTTLKQSQASETQPATTTIKSSSSLLIAPPHSEATHFGSDSRSKRPDYSQVRADYVPVQIPTTSVQSPSAAAMILGQPSKSLDHNRVNFGSFHDEGMISKSNQMTNNQGNLLIGQQISQGLAYVSTSIVNSHNDIAINVQNVLQQQVSDRSNWAPPSIDYMKKPLVCQICKVTISDVDSLLVCDACEKGTHLRCLLSYGSKGIPKFEWHCPKCLIASKGKSFPPKYGRVTRSIDASKSSNTVGTHASSYKRAEMPESSESKVNHQKSITTGNSGLIYTAEASNLVAEQTASVSDSDSKEKIATEIHDLDFSAAEMKSESDGMICVIDEMPSEIYDKEVQKSELSPTETQKSASESILESKDVPEKYCPKYPNVTTETPQFQESNDSQAFLELKALPESKSDSDIRPCDQEKSQTTSIEDLDSGDGSFNLERPSTLDLHTVNWVGDILEALDEKTYYQSCHINGALHKLQDHVLVSCEGRNLFPSKLESLWEDNKNGSKWAMVHSYYFPGDLLEAAERPSPPENSEVYASANSSTLKLESIHGSCEVLPIDKFREESERRIQLGHTNSGLHPIFMCKWLYDESKSSFLPVTG